MSDIDEWVFESVLQFLKSPIWTTPIFGFIETHCHEFAPGEEENKLIYTKLHKEFCELVESLLSTFLEELGISIEAFVESVKRNRHFGPPLDPDADGDAVELSPGSELSAMIAEYILALDDFTSFRSMMEKRNVDMELEAMYEYAKYTSTARDAADDMSEEERFLFEMAIHLSLGDSDVTLKQLEAEDAELLQALILSIAAEQERLLKEELNGTDAPAVTAGAMQALNDEIHAKRVENVERVVKNLQENASPDKGNTPVKRIQTPNRSNDAVSSESPKKQAKNLLAPIKDRRQLVFGACGSGFTIGNDMPKQQTSQPKQTVSLSVTQPSFTEIKKEVESKLNINSSEPSKEELEQRAEYFKKQRDLLIKMKQAEREKELQEFKKENDIPSAPSSNIAKASDKSNVTLTNKDITIALARRFKEDIINETRKKQ